MQRHAGHGTPAGARWLELINDPDQIRGAQPESIMPMFQAMMRGGCRLCPAPQTRVCQNYEKPLSVVGHDLVSQWMTMPWDFKVQDVVAGGASDGLVPHRQIRAVMRHAEATASTHGHESVSMADYVEAIGTLARDYVYRTPVGEQDAEFTAAVEAIDSPSATIARGRKDSHARAEAFRANPTTSRRNGEEIVASLPFEAQVHDELAGRDLTWCQHVPHLFTRLLWRLPSEELRLLELFDLVEAVALERGHPGVTPRDVETALMRAAVTGIEGEEAGRE